MPNDRVKIEDAEAVAVLRRWRANGQCYGVTFSSKQTEDALDAAISALSTPTQQADEPEGRAITALKVTLFEVECYLPSSIAKSVQRACEMRQAGDGWREIAEAPEHGLLLTFHPRFGQRILRGDPHNSGWFLDETGAATQAVTHFRELPAAPQVQPPQGGGGEES